MEGKQQVGRNWVYMRCNSIYAKKEKKVYDRHNEVRRSGMSRSLSLSLYLHLSLVVEESDFSLSLVQEQLILSLSLA